MNDPIKHISDPIAAYFELIRLRPAIAAADERLPIVLNEQHIRKFSAENKLPMGVVFNNAPFYYVLADLCERRGIDACGQQYVKQYRYARVVYANPDSNGAVAVVKCADRFGLVTIFRHAPRAESIEFARGFGEKDGLTPRENILKELSEELGISPDHCTVEPIGQLRADTGLSGGSAQVFLACIDSPDSVHCTREEGISRFEWFSEDTLRSMIRRGQITDGITLAAYALYKAAV